MTCEPSRIICLAFVTYLQVPNAFPVLEGVSAEDREACLADYKDFEALAAVVPPSACQFS